MKLQLLFLSLIATFLIQCKSKKNNEIVKITIEMTITKDYCGGAAPSEEMLKELTSSKPLLNEKFYIVLKDEAGILLSETVHTTDETGKLTLKIKKGMYGIYLKSAAERKKIVENMEEKYRYCGAIFNDLPLGYLHAWDKGLQKVNVHIKCNPCYPPAP